VEFSLVENLPVKEQILQTKLLLSVVKFDAFEFALEKATELGVCAIVPLAAARSEKALLAAAPKRAERWRKILLEASQQCRRRRIPELALLTNAAAAALLRSFQKNFPPTQCRRRRIPELALLTKPEAAFSYNSGGLK